MSDDINLPSLPRGVRPLLIGECFTADDMTAYARAAVEAGRQDHVRDATKMVPSDEEIDVQPAASADPCEGSCRLEIGGQRCSDCGYVARFPLVEPMPAAPVAQEPVATLKGVDEYGPMLDWHRHWAEFPIGTNFFTAPVAAQAQRKPDGYAYRYPSGAHDTVLRFNSGEEVNGARPIETLPFWFAPLPDHQPCAQDREDALSQAARDVLAERQRQISAEGWTPEHDDVHNNGELADAAACYASPSIFTLIGLRLWPWRTAWWKPSDHRRNCVKAGALVIAEIERLDRAAARAAKGGDHD